MGELVCLAVPLVFVVTLVTLTVRSAVLGWKLRERWGTVHALRAAGTGAYREGTITESRLRGVPWTVMVSGVSGTALALLTGFVFAPSGLIGALVFGGSHSSHNWMAAALALASFDGFVLAIALYTNARRTLECEWGAGEGGMNVGLWSLCHHLGLIFAFLAAISLGHEEWWLAVAFAAPGLLHAGLTIAAARRVRAIQASLTPDERDRLEWAKDTRELRVRGMLG
ncbi:MAG: hypothetical protein VYE22_27305 [Myxococcota bacterium]|nr:hypothetical protein [Myxococcota bacterium]